MENEYNGKRVQVNMKVPNDLHEAGQDKAREDNRSFSNYVCNLIIQDIKKDVKKDKKIV